MVVQSCTTIKIKSMRFDMKKAIILIIFVLSFNNFAIAADSDGTNSTVRIYCVKADSDGTNYKADSDGTNYKADSDGTNNKYICKEVFIKNTF